MRIVHALSLVGIAIWWIFMVIWQPFLIHRVQSLAYTFSPPGVEGDVVVEGTQRALLIATRGTSSQNDVFFTVDEVNHLNDVAAIYQTARVLLAVIAFSSLLFLLFEISRMKVTRDDFHLASRILGILIVTVIGSLVLFPFFFVTFHKTLFPGGNWAFPSDALLIQLFPEDFWKIMMMAIIAGLAFFAYLYKTVSDRLYE